MIFKRINGAWKTVGSQALRANSAWKAVGAEFVRINGSWKSAFSSGGGGSAPVITSALSPAATQGQPFYYQIVATNFPTSYSAPSGLIAGWSLDTTTGIISGTTPWSGPFTIPIAATNAYGTDTKSLSLMIAAGAPTVTSSLSASATQFVPFSYNITGSNTPTSYSATGLPAGLSINTATGAITGTPSGSGVSNITIAAINAYGSNPVTLVLTVAAGAVAPVITSALTASATDGTAFTYNITASNGPTSYGATGLPTGLSINTGTGAITGTTSVVGIASVTITATNASGTDSKTLSLSVFGLGWSAGADCPVQRLYPTLILLNNGKVLLLPATTYGYDGSTLPAPVSDCYLYTPGTPGSWAATGSLITARSWGNTFIKLPDGRVMAIGGSTDSGGTVQTSNCEIYDPNTGVWTAAASLPQARSILASCVLSDGRVLVTGGFYSGSTGAVKSTYIYTPLSNTWATSADLTRTRLYAPAGRLSNLKPIIFGGQGDSSVAQTAETFDGTTWTLTTYAPPYPGLFVSYTATLTDGSVWFRTDAGLGPIAYIVSGDVQWKTDSPNMSPLHAATDIAFTAYSGGNGYLAAGGMVSTAVPSAVTHIYDETSNSWVQKSPLLVPRGRHGAVALADNSVLLVGGVTMYGVLLSSTAIFKLP